MPVALAVLLGLYLTSRYSYLLFHSLVEMFSLMVAFGIFVIAWNSRSYLNNNYLLLIGIAYLFVSGIDLMHILAYKGMGVFRGFDANQPTQLWIAARSLQAGSLLAAPFFIERRLNHRILLALFGAVAAALLWSILYARIFPDCYREETGLTTFKIVAEYVIVGALAAAIALFLRHRNAFDARVLRLLNLSLAATIVSELAFTFYVGVYDLPNLLGHLLKLAAFFFLYMAIVDTGLRRPYELIFRDLQQNREELLRARSDLLLQIEERTGELTRTGRLYEQERTERTRAESAHHLSEQRYKRLVESVTDYIYTVHLKDGRPVATRHGPGCVTVTGYRPEEYDADPALWYRMVHEEDRPLVDAQVAEILAGAPAEPVEHRIRHKDGSTRWVRNTPVPRYDVRGALISYDGLICNITERKRLEEQLRHSQKLEAVGQLAGGIAHDFNNILSAIVGYGNLLQMKMEEDDPLRAHVSNMLEAAERASHLTHSLLAFSRKQLIMPAPVNLCELILLTEKFLRRIIGEDIELLTIFRQDRIAVHADRSQLEHVFMNLAANARDAMPRGGRLAIEADVIDLDESFIDAHGFGAAGRYALISVADTGEGMDESVQKRVFEPFFTTKEPGKGTGLGLSMVYGIVKQHNGFINVYSEPGHGTIFRIYLPLISPPERSAAIAAVPLRDIPRGSEVLLLAEDDDAVRTLIASVLTQFGYSVIEAADGRAAVDAFLRDRDRIELVIMDMIMPKLSGRTVYEEMRNMRKDVKVLFITGYTADKLFTEGLLSEGAECLLKPLSPRSLLEKVRSMLDNE